MDLSNLVVPVGLDAVDLALFWADRGVPVLPTNPDTKAPWVGKEWERKATLDQTQIHAWYYHKPNARVGIKTGLACGCGCLDGPDVLDFDVSEGKPGLQQLETLLDRGVIDPSQAMMVATPSGGRHLWFAGSTQHNKQNDDSVWGIDLRAHHGMVLAPGNPEYRVRGLIPAELGPSPLWSLVAACPGIRAKPDSRKRAPAPARVAPSRLKSPMRPEAENAPGEESPLDWYCRQNDLIAILKGDGWTWVYEHQGRDYFVRPGKDPKDGVSANVMVNQDGRQTLLNFSSSVDLPTDRGLSAAQYYAYTHHRGDLRAAARAIRTGMMPRPVVPTTPLVASGANSGGVAGTPVPPSPAGGQRGGELVPSGQHDVPEPISSFWSRRPELREVWWKSQVGGVSPWAVLGNILAMVAGRVGPHVRLPPLGGVGQAASLNILVAVSGNSGMGKGRSSQIAREFMGPPYPPQRKPGTGQGIAAMFTVQTKEGPVQENDTVVLNVAEITQLGAHMNQQGATITSTLLEVYMAEELGEHYANKELRGPVREGAYRLALVAGVQPDNSTILFDHAASGLPQRFLWMPALWLDAILPDSGIKPPAPGFELPRWRAWSDILPGTLDDTLMEGEQWSPTDAANAPSKKPKEPEATPAPSKDEQLLAYSPRVARTIETDHTRRLNAIKKRLLAGEDDPSDPDSHLLLTRAKVAALLAAWLDQSTLVSDEMWELAGLVIWVSNDTRLKAHGRIRARAAERTQQRAAQQIAQKAAVDEDAERKHNAAYIRACDRLVHLVAQAGGWIGRSGNTGLNKKMSSKEKREYREAGIEIEDVLSDLVQAGKLESQEALRGGQTTIEYHAK